MTAIDMTGKVIGRLTVVGRQGSDARGFAMWLCHCACGNETVKRGRSIRCGDTQSCGCLNEERRSEACTSHGMHKRPEYGPWRSMIKRCTQPIDIAYRRYGGRGIQVCDRWHDIESFIADMGPRPSRQHSIERDDNDGDYEPGNCRWATHFEQQNNRRNNKLITINGVTQTVAQWERQMGLARGVMGARLRLGWSPEKAASVPQKWSKAHAV